MPSKGVYDKNVHKLTKKDTSKRKIFNFLIKCGEKGATQKQIKEYVKLSQSRVSDLANNLLCSPYTYGQKIYEVSKENGRYIIKCKNNNINSDMNTTTTNTQQEIKKNILGEEKEKAKERKKEIEKELEKFQSPKIWNNTYAKRITSTVVLYEVNTHYRADLITSINKLYGDGIYDIISCKEGFYIILNENDTTKATLKDVLDFYTNGCQ